jgi:hypothetical protein
MPAAFMNTPFPNQTGKFTARFNATPSASPSNGVVALTMGAQSGFAGYAVSARFNPMGMIDGVNGGAYESATTIAYKANTTYGFRMVVDVAAHKYALYVTPAGGAEATVGTDLGFRTGQTNVTGLNSWGTAMQAMATGTINVCGFAIE